MGFSGGSKSEKVNLVAAMVIVIHYWLTVVLRRADEILAVLVLQNNIINTYHSRFSLNNLMSIQENLSQRAAFRKRYCVGLTPGQRVDSAGVIRRMSSCCRTQKCSIQQRSPL